MAIFNVYQRVNTLIIGTYSVVSSPPRTHPKMTCFDLCLHLRGTVWSRFDFQWRDGNFQWSYGKSPFLISQYKITQVYLVGGFNMF